MAGKIIVHGKSIIENWFPCRIGNMAPDINDVFTKATKRVYEVRPHTEGGWIHQTIDLAERPVNIKLIDFSIPDEGNSLKLSVDLICLVQLENAPDWLRERWVLE